MTLAGAGFALGRNVSASRAQAHPGSAWLSTTGDGSVNLVDGISGGSAAKVPVPGASGHSMDVTQNGDLVFVRDTVVKLQGSLGIPIVDHDGVLWAPVTATGTVVPVNGDTAGASIAVDPGGSDMVMALAGGTPTVVDRTTGTLTAIAGSTC